VQRKDALAEVAKMRPLPRTQQPQRGPAPAPPLPTPAIPPQRESPDAILAKNLVVARLAAGVTQQDLAAAADVSRATIAQLETGYSDPRLSTIVDLANALGVSPLLLLIGLEEARALTELPDRLHDESLELHDKDVTRMQQYVASGMLKDRVRAARLGASLVASAATSVRVAAAVMSAILPGKGTIVGAALGRALAPSVDNETQPRCTNVV